MNIPKTYQGLVFLYEQRSHHLKIPGHTHRELEMNFVVNGTAELLVSGRGITIKKYTLLWLFPGHQHVLLRASSDYQMYVAVFKPQLIQNAGTTSEYSILHQSNPKGTFFKTIPLAAGRSFQCLLEKLTEGNSPPERINPSRSYSLPDYSQYTHADPCFLNAGLRFLLIDGWKEFTKTGDNVSVFSIHPSVQKAVRIIRDSSLSENGSSLAAQCGLSYSRLSRLFHQQIGISLTSYRNEKRLERFFLLMKGPRHYHLTEAAFEAGFGSYAQFYSIFKKALGYGPNQYQWNRGSVLPLSKKK